MSIVRFKYGKLKFSRPSVIKSYLEKWGVWEKERTSNVLNILKPGQLFVDVGAHVGYYSVLVGNYFEDSVRIIAFEPDVLNFNDLKENIYANNIKNIVLENKAVSNYNGILHMRRKRISGWTQVTKVKSVNSFDVECVRLDTYLKDYDLNLIKVDVEGHELEVLEGIFPLYKNNDFIILVEYQYNKIHQELKEDLKLYNLKYSLKEQRLKIWK